MTSSSENSWASLGAGLERCDAFRFYRVRNGTWFGSVTVLSEIYTGDGRTQVDAVAKALEKAAKAAKGGAT